MLLSKMKKVNVILFILSIQSVYLSAQMMPKGMNYQAVVRKIDGVLMTNEKVELRVVLFSHADGDRMEYYTETHETHTNALGLFNLIIGEGKNEKGEYSLIPWNDKNIWMEVSFKDLQKSKFTVLSSSKLMSVPYAIHAGTTDRIADQNQITTPSSFGPPEPGVISTDWSVLGNAKTDASGNIFRINSLGTADFVDLIMITDNIERLRILAGGDIRTKLNFEVGKNVTVGQKLFVLHNATFCDSLIVKKNVVLNTMGGATFNFGPFTVANLSPSLLTGSLTVNQITTFNTSLNVDGVTLLNNRLTVTKKSPTKLTGTLQVDSTVNLFGGLNINKISPTYLSGKLTVDSCATFLHKFKILSQYQTDTSSTLPSGALQVGGGAYVRENLWVGGITKFGGPAAFGSSVAITDKTQSFDPNTGALVVVGGTGIGLNLNVGGMAMFNGMTTVLDLTQSFTPTTGALKVLGGLGIRKRLNVGGSSIFQKSLTVAGPGYLSNSLSVSNGGDFIANFKNLTGPHGISIQVANPSHGWANNFVEFRNSSNGVVGRIEGENASQYLLNQRYINELAYYNTAVLQAELLVASTAVDLAAAIAGIVTAATSVTFCVGLGVCTTSPIPSMIVKSVAKAALYAGAVGIVSYLLVSANDSRDAFITYRNNRIGVTYESGSGDYAEWLPKIQKDEMFLPGYVVAVKNGKITKMTDGANKFLVISTKPIVLGNAPDESIKKEYEQVAFMGQVPVYVTGKVNAGDYIVPSGLNNGFGKAIAPADMKVDDFSKIIGVAWSATTDNTSMVNVGIGLNTMDLSKLVAMQNTKIKELESEFYETNLLLEDKVPGYKQAAKAAGIDSESGINHGATDKTKPAFLATQHFLGRPLNLFNPYEISSEQVLSMLDMAVNFMSKDNTNMEANEFIKRIKNDSEYKNEFILDIQNTYKKEVQIQIEKWRPH